MNGPDPLEAAVRLLQEATEHSSQFTDVAGAKATMACAYALIGILETLREGPSIRAVPAAAPRKLK